MTEVPAEPADIYETEERAAIQLEGPGHDVAPLAAVAPPVEQQIADVPQDDDGQSWEDAYLPFPPCPKCGGIDRWWNYKNESRCPRCQPPHRHSRTLAADARQARIKADNRLAAVQGKQHDSSRKARS